jgi:hypothetical protein
METCRTDCCSFVVSLLILFTTNHHTLLNLFHQILNKGFNLYLAELHNQKNSTFLRVLSQADGSHVNLLATLVTDFQLIPESGREFCPKEKMLQRT